MKRISIWLKVLCSAILIVLLVKAFAFTSCVIPSRGMENSLYQGERILVNKWSYGLRLPFTTYRLLPKRASKGDIVLFNNPHSRYKDVPLASKGLFISRCAGTPGDTLMLNDELIITGEAALSPDSKQLYAYSHGQEDTLTTVLAQLGIEGNTLVGYSDGHYLRSFSHYEAYLIRQRMGDAFVLKSVHMADSAASHPFIVPAKGQTVKIYPWNMALLCNTILHHEHHHAAIKRDTLWVDGKPVSSYTFSKDYYWMVSNNPVNLSDSRLFGLVPHDHLVGKACRIWYSSRKERIFQPIQ